MKNSLSDANNLLQNDIYLLEIFAKKYCHGTELLLSVLFNIKST